MHGYCNICNRKRKLTLDHVPPQGATGLHPVDFRPFITKMSEVPGRTVNYIYADKNPEVRQKVRQKVETKASRRRISQNGIKFRSICSDCNNKLLGGRYDPEIIRISREVGRIIRAHTDLGFALPQSIRVPVKTHYLLRGVIGHLLAALESPDASKPLPDFGGGVYEGLRAYVLDESLPLPDNVTVYYWTYPSQDQVIIKSLSLATRNGYLIGDLLKFFPLAYYISFGKGGDITLATPFIKGDCCNDMNCTVELHVHLKDIPPADWPETPGPYHATVMPMEASVVATARRKVLLRSR